MRGGVSLHFAIAASVFSVATVFVFAQSSFRLQKGEELVYEGNASLRFSSPGQPTMEMKFTARSTHLVLEAEARKGYRVGSFVQLDPEGSQPGAQQMGGAFVRLTPVGEDFQAMVEERRRMGWSLSEFWFGELLPFYALVREGMGVGTEWQEDRKLPMFHLQASVNYKVSDSAPVAGHACWYVETTSAKLLAKQRLEGFGVQSLTGTLHKFAERFWVGKDEPRVVKYERELEVQLEAGQQKEAPVFGQTLSLTLKSSQLVAAAQLEQKAKQLQALDEIQRSANPMALLEGEGDPVQTIQKVSDSLKAFKSSYPQTPYQPAVASLEAALTQMKTIAERMAKRAQNANKLLNQPAPDFNLPDLDGKKHSLSDFKGKVIVLNFFASW